MQCGSTIATCATLPIPIANLAGIFRLARVPIKLLLEIGLGVDGSTERAHRDFEFPAANVQTATTGVELSHLTTLRLRFFGDLFISTIGVPSLAYPAMHSI